MNPHHQQVIDLLKAFFKENKITGIEIGTAEGHLPKHLLEFLPNLEMIYTIDPYIHVPNSLYEAALDQYWHDVRKNQATEGLKPYPGRYELLCITSDEAVSKTPETVDFVWIDGDHTVSQVIKDINNYYPKVRSGGIFGGHDSHIALPVLAEIKLKEEIHQGNDLTWWMYKE